MRAASVGEGCGRPRRSISCAISRYLAEAFQARSWGVHRDNS